MDKVRDVCVQFLDEKWTKFCDEIVVKQLNAGFANETYLCSLSKADRKHVIVKIFGSEYSDQKYLFKFNGICAESLMHYILYLNGIAPKLLAVFDQGRIEEFVKGRNATTDDFYKDESLFSNLAKILVKIHGLSMPISRRILYMDKIYELFSDVTLQKPLSDFNKCDIDYIQNLFNFAWKSEYEWFMKCAPLLNSKIVFSHNDVHQNNLIIRDSITDEEDKLVLLDYEMSGYNYRGFDIGYFLVILCHRVSKKEDKISIQYLGDLDPEIERKFIESYIKELAKKEDLNNYDDIFDQLIVESRFFRLLTFLVLLGFGKRLINNPNMYSQMESFEYIKDWIDGYESLKMKLCQQYHHIVYATFNFNDFKLK